MKVSKGKARVYLSMVQDRIIDWKEHDKKHHGGHFDEEAYKRHEISCTLRDAEKVKENADRVGDADRNGSTDYPQVSSEARHSTKLDFGKWLKGDGSDPRKAYERQMAFQRATQDATRDLFNEVAELFADSGARKVAEHNLIGFYEDTYTDGLQEEIELPILTDKDGNQYVKEEARKAMDAYCALQCMLRRQDAVTWNAPLECRDRSKINGYFINTGNFIDYESYHDLVDDFNEQVDLYCTDEEKESVRQGNIGFVSTRNGVRIVDFDYKLSKRSPSPLSLICNAINEKYGTGNIKDFVSAGSYISDFDHDWSDDNEEYGKGFKALFAETGHENELKALYNKYKDKVYAAESAAAKELGYDKPLKKHNEWK